MSEPKPARPPQVTLAGWLVVAGSVVVVLTSFSEAAGLRSLDTRESVEQRLAEVGGHLFGMGVEGVLTLLRVAAMVAAASAAATAILGWQVLQRSKGARVALSLLAAPLFLAGMVQGGLASAVVTAAIVMLWFQPARDWFDGITRPTTPRPDPFGAGGSHGPPFDVRREAVRDPALDRLPPPSAPPLHPTPYAGRTGVGVGVETGSARPAAVTWACALTWLFASAAFALLAYTLVVVAVSPGQLLDQLHQQDPSLADQGITDATLKTALVAVSVVVLLWSAAAMALAVLVWRRVAWAAVALMVSAGLAGALCLVTVVGSLLLVVPVAACAATLALLLRPESRAWLRR